MEEGQKETEREIDRERENPQEQLNSLGIRSVPPDAERWLLGQAGKEDRAGKRLWNKEQQ